MFPRGILQVARRVYGCTLVAVNILTCTRLFPNPLQPTHGVFVGHRTSALAAREDSEVRVVAPVPFYPRFAPGPAAYTTYARVPLRERRGAVDVDHPRYPVVPGIGLRWQGPTLAHVLVPLVDRIARERRIDVLDAHYIYPDGFAAVEAGRRLGIPVVVNAVGSDVYGLPRLPGIRELTRRTLAGAAAIIGVSDAIADQLVDEMGVPRGKITVIHYGVDASRFTRDPAGARRVRARLGLHDGERLVLTVGRLHRMKAHDVLVDAFARFAATPEGAGVRLVIVGEGDLREETQARIRARGLEGRVTLAGAVLNELLPAWYSAADLFCLPSRGEGHPNVLLEALACGTPAVASAVGAIPETLTPSCGAVVPPEDAERLAAALRDGLAAVRDGRWTPEASRAAVDRRTWRDVAEESRAVFADAIRKHAQRGASSAPRSAAQSR